MSDRGAAEILLVEDNAQDLELTLRALTKAKLAYNVAVARDGAEALDFLFGEGRWAGRELEQPPKLMLLDMKLPKIDGLEVLQRVKADPRTRPIPVVVFTSSELHSDVLQSYQLGANSYCVKPVEFERFLAVITQLGTYWLLLNRAPRAEGL